MFGGGVTADAQFGPDPAAVQPSSGGPEHLGRPEPVARTMPTVAQVGGTESPALAMVVLLAVAIGLLHLISR